MSSAIRISLWVFAVSLAVADAPLARAQRAIVGVFPPQRSIEVRDPAKLPRARLPAGEAPPTVQSEPRRETRLISLDEAIRIGLANSEVVRVLAGASAVNSGRTVYDPAIASTAVPRAESRFDPQVDTVQDFFRNENPFALRDPLDPSRVVFDGTRNDLYDMTVGLSKESSTGARAAIRVDTDRSRTLPIVPGDVLNPESRPSLTMSVTQPLLRGAGVDVNLAPVVLARIDTERSYFRLKDAIQGLVRDVVQAYWQLIAARTNVWAVEQQLEQTGFTYRREEFRSRVGDSALGPVSQAQVAFLNFEASLIAARGNVLDRESALRSILGLPPTGPKELVPSTYPATDSFKFDWPGLVDLAEQRRPNLIELKLILEADYQLLLQSRNQTLPRLDATGFYRWNGVEGELITTGTTFRSGPGEFTDWRLGIDFSVPLGQRQARAGLREQELLLARDQANLDQALLEVVHELAATLRQLDRQFAQYKAFRQTRAAAANNLRVQTANQRLGRIEFVTYLLAITDWGNAISSEAVALTEYNTSLATLELLTGTILEAHGVYLYEERFHSLGPLGILGHGRSYPQSIRAQPNADRYGASGEQAEDFFELTKPDLSLRRDRRRDRETDETPNERPVPRSTPRQTPESGAGTESMERLPPVSGSSALGVGR